MRGFRKHNKEEIFQILDNLEIIRTDNQIVTKFNDRIISTEGVSRLYEVFDIVKYLKSKINDIEENFNISKYKLDIRGGKQSLQLISDTVNIGDVKFHKSFFIINSTDRSRRLSFNIGLKSDKFYSVSGNIGLTKKHLKGVTQAAEEASVNINDETFTEQINAIEEIVGEKIKFSSLRNVIIGDGDIKSNHLKFDAFKNSIKYNLNLSKEQIIMLSTTSEELNEIPAELDFTLDAFYVFCNYLTLFSKYDSHVVKNQTDHIMKMTQWFMRNEILESIGI